MNNGLMNGWIDKQWTDEWKRWMNIKDDQINNVLVINNILVINRWGSTCQLETK